MKSIENLILGSKGKIFSVIFKKKDGTTRIMSCRLGVRRYVKGKGLKYNPKEKNLLIVFDMNKRGYRSIPLDRIMTVKVNGNIYEF